MTDYEDMGACTCGTRGTLTLVSPTILKGGSTQDSVYEIESQGRRHLVRYYWNEEERRYRTLCLKAENKLETS